jgi:3-methyl-2-oxobutanoate hydroxymethyltransferase
LILVGDSLGQWVLGYDTTVPVTVDDMVHHIKAVVRGTQKAHVVGDMPFMSYQADISDALRNAGRLIQEGGAQSVKLEGGRRVAETVRRIVEAGMPVMGHIGLTPQSVNQMGHRVQGRSDGAAAALMEDALALESAGAYSLVLELVTAPIAAEITDRLAIPTIGIGSGVHCDGQVQVLHDALGLIPDNFVPKHARRYAELAATIENAMSRYIQDVQTQSFPSEGESPPWEQASPTG